MKLKVGNMWDHQDEYGIMFVTTSSSLNSKKELVMGAGAAKWVKDNYPNAPSEFGKRLTESGMRTRFGISISNAVEDGKICIFQSKIKYNEPSTLDIIAFSTGMLVAMIGITEALDFPKVRYSINFPGIGLGELNPVDVYPIIKPLPSNVDVWMYEFQYDLLIRNVKL